MSQINSISQTSAAAYFIQSRTGGNNKANSGIADTISSIAGENSTQPKSDSVTSSPTKEKIDYASQFMDYMKKTPAERLREEILKKLGLTEDDLKSMPPEEREAVEQTIAQEIKRALQDGEMSAKDSDLQKFGSSGNFHLSNEVNSMLLGLQEV